MRPEKYVFVGVESSRPAYLKSVAFIVHTRESPFVRSTYIRVILLEAAIIIGLVILGRLFS